MGGGGRSPRDRHGHELRQPGARRGISGREAGDPRAKGLPDTQGDRPRNREVEASGHQRPDRPPHPGTEKVPRIVGDGDLRGPAAARGGRIPFPPRESDAESTIQHTNPMNSPAPMLLHTPPDRGDRRAIGMASRLMATFSSGYESLACRSTS